MEVKKFNFPSFEQFRKHNKFEKSVGTYKACLAVFSWNVDGEHKTYHFAMSSDFNPLNIYSRQIFFRRFDWTPESDKNGEFEAWYNKTLAEFEEFWDKFIKETYLENTEEV